MCHLFRTYRQTGDGWQWHVDTCKAHYVSHTHWSLAAPTTALQRVDMLVSLCHLFTFRQCIDELAMDDMGTMMATHVLLHDLVLGCANDDLAGVVARRDAVSPAPSIHFSLECDNYCYS
eukprot:TRINITY_DN132_c2_g2_i7.p1 TRINITY_DN132_c2_g2~~TRINITY_DN132_c2_g2_i7.p1  ORF type:complete len:119 (-),score=1.27 TRINITY_DN132_c2_g2_i7:758-1114(-)